MYNTPYMHSDKAPRQTMQTEYICSICKSKCTSQACPEDNMYLLILSSLNVVSIQKYAGVNTEAFVDNH